MFNATTSAGGGDPAGRSDAARTRSTASELCDAAVVGGANDELTVGLSNE